MGLTGKVVEKKDNWVFVEVMPIADCQGCTTCKGLGDGEPGKKRTVQALTNDHSPQVGDEVILDNNPGEGTIAAFLVFGFPLLGFVIGIFSTGPLLNYLGIVPRDIFLLAGGGLGLVIPWLVIWAIGEVGFVKKLSLKVVKVN